MTLFFVFRYGSAVFPLFLPLCFQQHTRINLGFLCSSNYSVRILSFLFMYLSEITFYYSENAYWNLLKKFPSVIGFSRGRILGLNLDRSIRSFPPCCSVISAKGFYVPPPSRSDLKLVCNVNTVLYMETSSLSILKIMPWNLNEIVRSWIRLLCPSLTGCTKIYLSLAAFGVIFQDHRLLSVHC